MNTIITKLLDAVSTLVAPYASGGVVTTTSLHIKRHHDHSNKIYLAPGPLEIVPASRHHDRFSFDLYVLITGVGVHQDVAALDALQARTDGVDAVLRRRNLLGGGLPEAHWYKQVLVPDALWLLRLEEETNMMCSLVKPSYWFVSSSLPTQ